MPKIIEGKIQYTRDYQTKGVVFPVTKTGAVYNNEGEVLDDLLEAKVEKVEGKGLSTNDFTNEYKIALEQYTSNDDLATIDDIESLFA